MFTPASMDKTTADGLKVSPFLRKRHVLDSVTLGEAVRGSDTYAARSILPGPMKAGYIQFHIFQTSSRLTDHEIAYCVRRPGGNRQQVMPKNSFC